MIGSTAGGLDAHEIPELPDTVWMRMLANALDPDTAPVDPALIPADGATGPDADLSDADLSDAVGEESPAEVWSDDVMDAAPRTTDGADAPDDGGAHLLPHPDAFPAHDPAGADHGGSAASADGPPWSDPHDDHGF